MVVHFSCVSEMQFAMSSGGIVKPTAVAVDEVLFFAAAAEHWWRTQNISQLLRQCSHCAIKSGS